MVSMADETNVKSFEALKIQGSIASKGTFKDRSGKEMEFTDEILDSIFSNFDRSIPFRVSHDDDGSGGYLYKFKRNTETNKIDYEGIMFDKDRISKIKNDGFKSISPEIDVFLNDDNSFNSARITAGAMTRVPGIKGMDNNIMELKFSEENVSGIPKAEVVNVAPVAEVVTPTVKVEAEPKAETTPESPAPPPNAEFEAFKVETQARIGEYETKITQLLETVSGLQNENVTFLNNQISGVIVELKSLGIENPESIGKGLNENEKLKVYKDLKSQLAKNKSSTQADVDIKLNEKKTTSVEDANLERAKKLGYEKEYLKIRGER